MRLIRILPLPAALALIGCGGPDPCAPLCAAAADAFERCLTEQGGGWPSLGHADRAAFLDACALRADEGRAVDAELDQAGHTERTCADWRAELVRADDPCAAVNALDWHTLGPAQPASARRFMPSSISFAEPVATLRAAHSGAPSSCETER
jgi:crotonobetainyl-CoA:carnitine CoA-transferase CaiB-like acyl-CoA transferase